MEMSRLTRDGTSEPVSRDQLLSQAQTGTGKYSFSLFLFPVQLNTSRIGNLTRLILLLLCVCDDQTYIHTYIMYLLVHDIKYSSVLVY